MKLINRELVKQFILPFNFFIIILLCFAHNCLSAIYYVKNSGDDKSSGLSDNQAWKTITKVNSFRFSEGDIVRFSRGSTFNDATLISPGVNNFTIEDYGVGNKPHFDADRIEPISIKAPISNIIIKNIDISGGAAVGRNARITITNVHGVTVDGIYCNGKGPDKSYYANGIKLVDCIGDIVIKNCEIHHLGPNPDPQVDDGDIQGLVIRRNNLSQSVPDSVNVFNNRIYNVRSDCIIISGFNPQKDKSKLCNIYKNILHNGGENAIDIKQSWYVDVHNNTIYKDRVDNHGGDRQSALVAVHDGPDQYPDEKQGSGAVKIFNNYIKENTNGKGKYWKGLYAGAGVTGFVHFYNNRIQDCYPAIDVYKSAKDIKIWGNMLIANKTPSELGTGASYNLVRQSADNAKFYNNTLVILASSTTGLFHHHDANAECDYKNNIIVNYGDQFCFVIDKKAVGSPRVDYNTYFNPNYSKRVDNKGSSTQTVGPNDYSRNPRLNDKYFPTELVDLKTGKTIGYTILDYHQTDFTKTPPIIAIKKQSQERGAWARETYESNPPGNSNSTALSAPLNLKIAAPSSPTK